MAMTRLSVTRRRLLTTMALAVPGLLAACGGAPASPTAAPKAAEPTKPAAAAPTTAAAAPAAKPAEPTKPAAAAPTAAPAAAKPAAASKPPVTLRQLDQTATVRVMTERMEKLKEQHPHITVKLESQPDVSTLFTKTQALQAGGQMTDTVITFNSNASYRYFTETKVLRAIDDAIAADKLELGEYYPGAVDYIKVQGKIYGLPFKGHPGAGNLFYNEKLFEAEGLKFPTDDWTWQQAIDAATKLTKGSGGTAQFGLLWQNNVIFWRNVWQIASGAELYAEDGKKVQINGEAFVKAVEWMHDLQQVKKVAMNPSQLTGTEQDMFASGKVGLWLTLPGQKSVGAKIKDQFKWMAVLAPKGHNDLRGPITFIDTFSVSQASKHPDDAYIVVKWLCNQETGIRLGEGAGAGASGTPGARPDVWNSPRLLNHPDYRPEAQQAGIKAMALLKPYRNAWNFRDQEVNTLVTNRLEAIWIGKEKPAKPYLDSLHAEAQAILDKPLPG
jgi:multiple sugar transport system substrate-binding protein